MITIASIEERFSVTFHPAEWIGKKRGPMNRQSFWVFRNLQVSSMVPRGCPKGWFWNRLNYPPQKKTGIMIHHFFKDPAQGLFNLVFDSRSCQGEEKTESSSVTLWVMSLGPVGGVSPHDMEPWYCVMRQKQRVFWDGQGWPLEAIFILHHHHIMTCCSRGMPMNCRRLCLEKFLTWNPPWT